MVATNGNADIQNTKAFKAFEYRSKWLGNRVETFENTKIAMLLIYLSNF